ncbi:MAG: ABC transporter ATP-binding protein [Actinomycetota bacterium]
MTGDRAMVQARHLSRRFGSARALNGIDLDVPAGETLVVFGHNGSGKTTLLRLMAGILRPTTGEVLVDGGPPRAARKRLGYLGHDLYLYPHLSVGENLSLFARLYDAGPAEADRALCSVALGHKRDALVHTLSRGEGQRAALARATLHDPDLLLVDEPFSGLDEASARALPALLQRAGRTLVLATHDTERGEAIADRIVVLEQGRLSQPMTLLNAATPAAPPRGTTAAGP